MARVAFIYRYGPDPDDPSEDRGPTWVSEIDDDYAQPIPIKGHFVILHSSDFAALFTDKPVALVNEVYVVRTPAKVDFIVDLDLPDQEDQGVYNLSRWLSLRGFRPLGADEYDDYFGVLAVTDVLVARQNAGDDTPHADG